MSSLFSLYGYLENVTVDELHEILAEVDEKKPVQRVLAGIASKDSVNQKKIAEQYGVHPNTVRNWLNRLERLFFEPFESVVYDDPRPGQSRDLDEDEHERFVEALHDTPEKVGRDARAWTVTISPAVSQGRVRYRVLPAPRPSIDVRGRAALEDSPAGVRRI